MNDNEVYISKTFSSTTAGRPVTKEVVKAAIVSGAFFNFEDLIEASVTAVTDAVWAVLTE